MNLFVRYRTVFGAPRDDEKLALCEPDVAIPELHAELAADDQEQLILVVVLVPHVLSPELDQLDVLAIRFVDHLRTPVVGEQGQILPRVHLLHVAPVSRPDPCHHTKAYRSSYSLGFHTLSLYGGPARVRIGWQKAVG